MKKIVPIVPMPQKITVCDGVCGNDNPLSWQEDADLPNEGYIVQITKKGVIIQASGKAGFFYGQKTLEQLRCIYPNGIPCMKIEDAPAYPYRSFHIDTARHYFPLDELKRMINAAAAFKLNHFHWHFSDDQGWRIESMAYPLLHELGAKRDGDFFGKTKNNRTEHLYYTQEEVKELVHYCDERHIEIVPEIDIPGHVTAILAAYPHLSCTGKQLEVATSAGIFPDILCAGKEDVFAFLFELLDELCTLFPGKFFHLGGDETPKTRWNACPDCRQRMAAESLADSRALQGYLTNRLAAHLRSRGKRTIVWNEAALGDNLDTDIIIQLWNDDPKDPSLRALSRQKDENGKPTSPNQGIGSRMLRKGHEVLLSNMLSSYCDYPYSYVTLKNIYTWDMIPQKCEDIPKEVLTQVIGGECLCWTEYIRDGVSLERTAWPRYAAKAEALWTAEGQKNFKNFKIRLKKLYPFMKELLPGIGYPGSWFPNPIASAKDMMVFASNISGNIRSEYADAQDEV